jgi:hypothetical protein
MPNKKEWVCLCTHNTFALLCGYNTIAIDNIMPSTSIAAAMLFSSKISLRMSNSYLYKNLINKNEETYKMPILVKERAIISLRLANASGVEMNK